MQTKKVENNVNTSSIDSKDFINSMFGLSGRRTVVTGASSGLGRQMALVLAQAEWIRRRGSRLTYRTTYGIYCE